MESLVALVTEHELVVVAELTAQDTRLTLDTLPRVRLHLLSQLRGELQTRGVT